MAPPPALRPWRAAQMTRLQQIADTGHRLAIALRVGDRAAVTGLIKRFRFLLSHQPNVSQAQHDAVKVLRQPPGRHHPPAGQDPGRTPALAESARLRF
jgi:hypothetical protein